MSPELAHPRAVALVRTLLLVVGVVVTGVVLAVTTWVLMLVTLLGGLASVLSSDPVVGPVLGLLAFTLLTAGLVVGVVVTGVRRGRDWVVRRDEVPTPVEVVKHRYVAGELDEPGLERELEAVLDDRRAPTDQPRVVRVARRVRHVGRVGGGRSRELDVEARR
ncbi:hypothetical protein N0B31_04420 [Salinirubellus salinus]|jgi:uncharacterized membrane protein|uniref:SHOCT domain-containing protein n=1 Tax=Salinirubellus salinus TaxID=1364945 RepID=A0A9E7U940_9EURY|nr:hypothetical protein [Salinirubellus salinus]UWM55531.1 hypothetical protein N0B31_04420 [Salinirubellus salinus]